MVIGNAIVELHIPGANSLKDKRRVLKSARDRIRVRFNVSIAELEKQDCWREATLGLACISNDSRHAYCSLQVVIRFLEQVSGIEVVDYSIQII